MPLVNNYFVLRISLRCLGQGWTESYPLKEQDPPKAIEAGKVITDLRRYALVPNADIVWARVSLNDRRRDARAVISGVLTNTKVPASKQIEWAAQTPHDALVYRFETANGKWGNRFFRGVSDIEIVMGHFVLGYTPETTNQNLWFPKVFIPHPEYETYNANQSLTRLSKSFFYHLLTKTAHVRKVNQMVDGNLVVRYEFTDWARVVFRKVANKRAGRPFGQRPGLTLAK